MGSAIWAAPVFGAADDLRNGSMHPSIPLWMNNGGRRWSPVNSMIIGPLLVWSRIYVFISYETTGTRYALKTMDFKEDSFAMRSR
jgi:hypothetical protein